MAAVRGMERFSVLEAALMLERAAEAVLSETKEEPRSPVSVLRVAQAAVIWRRCQLELAEARALVLFDNRKVPRELETEDRDDRDCAKAAERQCYVSYHTWVLARTKCLRAQFVYCEALQHYLKLCQSYESRYAVFIR